jgi:GrpB-like predicted nucleotidyltransferase (UPF0157 family)
MPKPPVVLVPHDPRWARAFEEARAAIMVACGECVLDVLHVGSTAIPGIAAKPVIDMMALLRRHEDGFACVPAMAASGFEFRGEAGLGGRHFFRKGHPRTQHVHMYQSDHPEVGRHVRFRDYLRQHPDEASAYEALKRALATRFGSDRRAYSDAKSEFCARIEQLARAAEAERAPSRSRLR